LDVSRANSEQLARQPDAAPAHTVLALFFYDFVPLSFEDVENLSLDLHLKENCESVVRDVSDVYNLAANMGGMGFIEHNKALCMLSVLINTHMLQAAVRHGAKRFFYSSSACMYPEHNQMDPDNPNCSEESAYPANPDSEYGWEKLFSERIFLAYHRNHGMKVRVGRSFGRHDVQYINPRTVG